jgi:hypothetical protein
MIAHRILLVTVCVVAALWNSRASSQLPPRNEATQKSPDQQFEDLLARALKGPAVTDWKALRTAFAATSHYRPYNGQWREEIAKVQSEIAKGDVKSAEAMLVKLLERERFMRLDGHAIALALYEKTGESDKASKHRAFLEGLAGAVFKPGAGKSIEQPIEVLFIEEEYVLVGSLGLRVKRQAVAEHNGHRFDVLTTQAKEGQPEIDFFFNIDLPWQALDKSMGNIINSVNKTNGKK